jgi:hypothetical protein
MGSHLTACLCLQQMLLWLTFAQLMDECGCCMRDQASWLLMVLVVQAAGYEINV